MYCGLPVPCFRSAPKACRQKVAGKATSSKRSPLILDLFCATSAPPFPSTEAVAATIVATFVSRRKVEVASVFPISASRVHADVDWLFGWLREGHSQATSDGFGGLWRQTSLQGIYIMQRRPIDSVPHFSRSLHADLIGDEPQPTGSRSHIMRVGWE